MSDCSINAVGALQKHKFYEYSNMTILEETHTAVQNANSCSACQFTPFVMYSHNEMRPDSESHYAQTLQCNTILESSRHHTASPEHN